MAFLAQTGLGKGGRCRACGGSFMYDLQVETSDMDFTLVYQASPETLSLS